MATTRRKIPYYRDVDGLMFTGTFCPETIKSMLEYKTKPEDVFIVTFPKAGTTWTQQILYLLYHNGEPAKTFKDYSNFTPFLDLCGSEFIENHAHGPIKIHTPFDYTPYHPEAKYIYIVRNPKDTCVSFFYHTKNPAYDFVDGTFEEFFEVFINGLNDYGDYFDHLISWYRHRNDPNVLFLTYEQMKEDHSGSIEKIAKFLGPEFEDLVSDPEMLSKIVERSSINYMKKHNLFDDRRLEIEDIMSDPDIPEGFKQFMKNVEQVEEKRSAVMKDHKVESFIRKGVVGDWRSHFSEEQIQRLNARFKEKTEDIDISCLEEVWEKYGCL